MFHIDNICIITFSSKSTILFQYSFPDNAYLHFEVPGHPSAPSHFPGHKEQPPETSSRFQQFPGSVPTLLLPLSLRGKYGYHPHRSDRSPHHGISQRLPGSDEAGNTEHCLNHEQLPAGGSQMHSRFFQLVDRLPVGCRGTGFHQKKRCFLDASHKIMLHGSVQRCGIIVFFMPAWIIIPGSNIHNILKFL